MGEQDTTLPYNTLLELKTRKFASVTRELSNELTKLFLKYSNFDICPARRFTTITAGELVVTNDEGTETKPETGLTENVDCWPYRWLPNGTPYEYCRIRTPEPPSSLIEEFASLLSKLGPESSGLTLPFDIALVYIHNKENLPKRCIERVDKDKRTRYTKYVPAVIETSWNPGFNQQEPSLAFGWCEKLTQNGQHYCIGC